MKNLLVLSVFILLLTSCSQWDIDKDVDTSGYLKRIEDKSHSTIAEFKYNKNGSLKESWSNSLLFMSDKKEEYTYSYNEEGLLIEKEGFEPGNMIMSSMTGALDKDVVYSYVYDNKDRIEKITTSYLYEGMPELNYELTILFDYVSEDTIRTSSSFNRSESKEPSGFSEIIFNNEGNIIEKNHYYIENGTEKRISLKEEFTYDTKKAPFSFDPEPKSRNNIVIKVQKGYNYFENENGEVSYTSSFTYEYEYNKNDYPTKAIETYPNEIINTRYYIYF
ncbi:MAG: hypothetical protein PF541_02735 [Prolixibacteraceae bacterium]|jgi:hypothetical protein|nr:hypothetical protein [Prolixibacteraceae bacterium]